MTNKSVTLVPYRRMDDYRAFLWDCTRHALNKLGMPLTIGTCEGEWSRASAINNAAQKANDWEIALIADADTIPDPGSIRRAISWVRDTRGVARPHDQRFMLSSEGTEIFLRQGPNALSSQHIGKTHIGGGLLVVHREAWDKLGGYGEEYVGYGREDSHFNIRALVQSQFDRVPGKCWHLWHDRSECVFAINNQFMYVQLVRQYKSQIDAWAIHKGLAVGSENIF